MKCSLKKVVRKEYQKAFVTGRSTAIIQKKFGRQNNSVAKALLNHDHMTGKNDELEKNPDCIEVLKEYLEESKMARQAERMNIRGDTQL